MAWSQTQDTSRGPPSDVLGYLSSDRDKLEVRVTDEAGAGLFAARPISKGEVLYAVDVADTINTRDVREVRLSDSSIKIGDRHGRRHSSRLKQCSNPMTITAVTADCLLSIEAVLESPVLVRATRAH